MSRGLHIIAIGIEECNWRVKVADDSSRFNATTVHELKEKIIYTTGCKGTPDEIRLLFAGKQLDNHQRLDDWNITSGSTIAVVRVLRGSSRSRSRVTVPPFVEKEYPRYGFAKSFTSAPDCIDPYSDSTRRVKMKCGHAVDPNTLTQYCRSLLDQHIFQFKCPAIIDESNHSKPKHCDQEWDYAEVRLVALLTEEEMRYFESKMSEYAITNYCDVRECPSCYTFVERRDPQNLRVTCHICTRKKGRTYDFCWNCLKEWKSPPVTSAVKCGDPSCSHPDIPSVRDAPYFTFQQTGDRVPLRRACPTCGKVIEHMQEGCKMIICPRCKIEFCFKCLQLRDECFRSAPSSWFGKCGRPVAPKQTSIPYWYR